MSSIIEIAARNELLRQAGHHPARDLVQQIEAGLLTTDETGRRIRRPPSTQFRAIRANESAAPPPVRPRGDKE
jgi:HPr kinase/phosphorylase